MFEYVLNWIVKPNVCWLEPSELESNPWLLDISNKPSEWKIKLLNNNNVIQFVLISSANNGLPDKPFSATHIKCMNKNRAISEVVNGSYKTVINDKERCVEYYFYPTMRTTLFNLTFQYWQSFKVIVSFNLNNVSPLRELSNVSPKKIQPTHKFTSTLPQAAANPAQPIETTQLYVFTADNPHAEFILQDYDRLLNDHRHSDFKLIVQDHHFRCHKSILAARSEVFADLIKRNDSDTITLPAIDVETAADLLHYIYAGRAPNIKKNAERLMVAAVLFDLKILKFRCEATIKSEGNVDKALTLLQLTKQTETSITKGPAYKQEV